MSGIGSTKISVVFIVSFMFIADKHIFFIVLLQILPTATNSSRAIDPGK